MLACCLFYIKLLQNLICLLFQIMCLILYTYVHVSEVKTFYKRTEISDHKMNNKIYNAAFGWILPYLKYMWMCLRVIIYNAVYV